MNWACAVLLACALLVALAAAVPNTRTETHLKPIWTLIDRASGTNKPDGTDGAAVDRRRGLEVVDEGELVIDFGALLAAVQPSLARSALPTNQAEITFPLPADGNETQVSCNLNPSDVFHPALAAKFPELYLRSGDCDDGRSMSLTFLSSASDSFSAVLSVPESSDWLYVDNKEPKTNRYVIRRRSKLGYSRNFTCHMEDTVADKVTAKDILSSRLNIETSQSGPCKKDACSQATVLQLSDQAAEQTFEVQVSDSNIACVQTEFLCSPLLPLGAPSRVLKVVAPSDGIYSFSTCGSMFFDSVMRIAVNSCEFWSQCIDDAVTLAGCSFEHVELKKGHTVLIQIAAFMGGALPSSFVLTVAKQKPMARKLRIALITNSEYSRAVGDTDALVANAVAAVLMRVNGIFWREVGVFFQLIPENDRLFCTTSNANMYGNCDSGSLPNDLRIVDNNLRFLENRVISFADYDIAHSFTTYEGGAAAPRSICTARRARGASGQPQPFGDAFAVDFVAHELGHQLGAEHTFKDCPNLLSDTSKNSAVEPGSGSSIMSYAGLCKSYSNLQDNVDPYFHGISLHDMRNHLLAQPSCGEEIWMPDANTSTIDIPDECIVPSGNYFQLRVKAPEGWFVQWDQADPAAFESYNSRNIPRFRSWTPTLRQARYFPNLVYLANGVSGDAAYERFEQIPKVGTTRTMHFAVTMRQRYSSTSALSSTDPNEAGRFMSREIRVSFTKQTPLHFKEETISKLRSKSFLMGTTTTLKWKKSPVTKMVTILIAQDTFPRIKSPLMDYETDVTDPDWEVLGEFPTNSESAKITFPVWETTAKALIMLKGDGDECFSFDLISGINLLSEPAADAPFCKGRVGMTRKKCNALIKRCRAQGRPMFYIPHGCRGRRSRGCYCRTTCSFRCRRDCLKNSNRCFWANNSCKPRLGGKTSGLRGKCLI